MLTDEKKNILKTNYVLNKIKDGRKKIKFDRDRKIVFIIAFITSLLLIVALYIVSPFSKTIETKVIGNYYLDNNTIIEKAKLNDIFLLTNPYFEAKELSKDPLIKNVSISMLDGRIVEIIVEEEKQIGYIFEDEQSKLLLMNDTRIILDKNNMHFINKVPLIAGFTKEELLKVEKGFSELEPRMINEISEIHKYPVSYDDEQLEVIMRDGNFCFLSSSSLKLLENYYSVAQAINKEKGHACVYFDDLSNSAYISTCPWQQEEVERQNSVEPS